MRDRKSDSAHRRSFEVANRRKLQPGEDVHHADGDKTNNAPSNLSALPHGKHSAHTASRGERHLRKLRKALRADPAHKMY